MPAVAPLEFGPSGFVRLPAGKRYLQLLAVAIACCSGVVVLESSQVFMSDASRGYVLPSVHYLAWASFNWFGLALLAPLIYELGRRYPLNGPQWARRILYPHAAACLGCLAVQAICRGIAGWLYTLNHELPASPGSLAGEWIEKRLLLAFIAYWLIVIVAGFAQLAEEVRRREIHQAQLEARLASAELEKLRIQIQP